MTSPPLDLRSDALHVQIRPRGAALVGVRFTDNSRNLVLGFADPEDHDRVPIYAGALVGPMANRVTGGRVTVDGQTYQMPQNEGMNCLHSGADGLHAQDWQVTHHDALTLTMTCALPDGAIGLPGNRLITATYALAASTLTLMITATTDRATPINIAAHPYWNLDGLPDVSRHSLRVAADSYLPTDAANLPTGVLHAVAGTGFDFRTTQPVPLDPALDVNFCLTPDAETTATLWGADGTCLQVLTNAPGLQVYGGAHLPLGGPATTDGSALAPYAALALEPQHWPDAPTHTAFPSIILSPSKTYRQVTEYTLIPS